MDYPTANIVKNYLNLGFRGREISEVVNIPYGTLRYFMSRHGLSLRCTYSQISADVLESIIYQVCSKNPMLGAKMFLNRTHAMGNRVPGARVREAMTVLFGPRPLHRKLKRRQYNVRAPLSVVHIDGNHNLIMYMAIHSSNSKQTRAFHITVLSELFKFKEHVEKQTNSVKP
ncbi:Uncharacterized protein APZ42_015712 [Daphnia magna]|uniref:Uncharacterized protein n=1 Tax=Daphnia magna TaxID=35525 RepID=A0A162NQH3_9CRUS|nr:Uncharacterized protein APZ42_015712 [Daphnia magna]